MSTRINIKETNHEFEKQNLVTRRDSGGLYDLYKCKNCGLEAKGRQLGTVDILAKDAKKLSCAKAKPAQRIRITKCNAHGKQFANLTPDSEHDAVPAPEGESSARGVWVMGVGEPVLVLFGEFREI